MNFALMLSNLGQVTLAGLILGAGLPALFALGVRLTQGAGKHPGTVSKAIGYLCFAVIIAAIIIGILWITKAVIYESFAIDLFNTEAAKAAKAATAATKK